MAMCKITTVKAARQSQGVCGKCRKPIEAGMGYLWWKGRYTPKYVRCLARACSPEPWELETNALRQDHMRAEDAVSKAQYAATSAEAAEHVRDALASIEGVTEALTERLSGWDGTGLANSSMAEACQSSFDELESWAQDAEAIADELDELEPPAEGTDEEDEAWATHADEVAEVLSRLDELPELDLGA